MSDLTSSPATSSQLVPVFPGQIGGLSAQVCDGRTLHAFLENERQFADWIKQRVEQYGFQENQDFAIVSQKSETIRQYKNGERKGTAVRTDYHLCLDMAKELSMVENNAKGRQARRYFIDCERRAQAAQAAPINPMPVPTCNPLTLETRVAINRRAYALAGQEFDRMHTILLKAVRSYAQEHPGADLVAMVDGIRLSDLTGDGQVARPNGEPAPEVPKAPEYLSAAQEQELSRLAVAFSYRMPLPKAVTHAFWYRLRQVTGVPSPGRFEVRHLPLIVEEVTRINALTEAFKRVQYDAGQTFIRRVLRGGADAGPILAEVAQEIDAALGEADGELKDRLKPWQIRLTAPGV